MEFITKCYPAFEPDLTPYIRTMERIAVLVTNIGLLILDHAWRSAVFENGTSFLPGGAFPAAIEVEFQFVIAHHLRPAPDAAALICSNCGCQHRAVECPSFTLSFKHTPVPSDARLRRGRSSSRRATRSPSESLVVGPLELASQA